MNNNIKRIGTLSPTKFLISNVHGTLLDSSVLCEPIFSTSICMHAWSLACRIVIRPWPIDFIGKCFKNFRVAFWDITRNANMEDIVAEMMRKFGALDSNKPMFCWYAKECEEVFENIGVSKWKNHCPKCGGFGHNGMRGKQ